MVRESTTAVQALLGSSGQQATIQDITTKKLLSGDNNNEQLETPVTSSGAAIPAGETQDSGDKNYVLEPATKRQSFQLLNNVKSKQPSSTTLSELRETLANNSESILILDLRAMPDFDRFHVSRSVNVELPTLIAKRLRKGTANNLNLANFMPNEDAKQTYSDFKSYSKSPKTVLVLDEDMEDDANAESSDAWALLAAFSKGHVEELTPETVEIKFYKGGFDGLLRDRSESPPAEGERDIFEPIAYDTFFQASEQEVTPIQFNGIRANSCIPGASSRKHSMQLDTSLRKPSLFGGNGNGAPGGERKKSIFAINTQKTASPAARSRNTSISLGAGKQGSSLSGPRALVMRKASMQIGLDSSAARHAPAGLSLGTPLGGSFPVDEVPTPTSAVPKSAFPEGDHVKSFDYPPDLDYKSYSSTTADTTSAATEGSGSRAATASDDADYVSLEEGDEEAEYDEDEEAYDDADYLSSASSPVSEPISEIKPYLYLGSDYIPQSDSAVEQLSGYGITHILNMAAEVNPQKLEDSGKFGVRWVKAEDYADHSIEDSLLPSVEWIADAVAKGDGKSRVFVHCHAGRSRSATVVIAYLIIKEKMTLRDAYDLVKRARPGVSPNIGFMMTLQKIDKEYNPGQQNSETNGIDFAL